MRGGRPTARYHVTRICLINEVKDFNRVSHDITGKPPGAMEWE
jgi:GMP synthase PP-ATPase subunit